MCIYPASCDICPSFLSVIFIQLHVSFVRHFYPSFLSSFIRHLSVIFIRHSYPACLPQNNDSLLNRTTIIPKAQFAVFTPSVIDYHERFY